MTLDPARLPRHIAVIMDGNGRWAEQRGLSRGEGHKAGTRAAKAVVTRCRELGVGHLTLYTFSRENWRRPRQEVGLLFDLLRRFLKRELDNLLEQDIRLEILGEPGELPLATRQVLSMVQARTRQCSAMVLNLALNYSGRAEIARAARRIVEDGLAPDEVTERAVSDRLYTAGQPDPDLVIRTSGELRISNYLLFQSAYAEYVFTDVLWPDFTPAELERAIQDYQGRQRRFGATGGQVEG